MSNKKLSFGLLFSLILILSISVAFSTMAPSLTTDKADYEPGETVLISGEGFLANTQLTQLDITRPDGHVSECPIAPEDDDGHGMCSDDLPTTDSEGAFEDYEYELDGIAGEYIIDASDGTNEASVEFYDARSINWGKVDGGRLSGITGAVVGAIKLNPEVSSGIGVLIIIALGAGLFIWIKKKKN